MKLKIYMAFIFVLFASATYGQFAYLANGTSNNISAYRIDAGTGILTAVGTFPTAQSPSSIAVDPTTRFLYVAGLDSIRAHRIDHFTGALTQIQAIPTGGDVVSYSIAVDPSGMFAYVANSMANTVSSYRIDTTTGALTPAGAVQTGLYPYSVAVTPLAPRFVYTCSSWADPTLHTSEVLSFAVDGTTGTLSRSGPPQMISGYGDTVAVDASNQFAYVVGSAGISGFRINPVNGGLTSLGPPFATVPNSMPGPIVIDPRGRAAYVVNLRTDSISTYAIQSNGALSLRPGWTVATGRRPRGMAIDPTGNFAYVANLYSGDVSMYSIDWSGALASLGTPVRAGIAPVAVAIAPCAAPPEITGVSASPAVLWPPNNKMTSVSIAYSATAPCGFASCHLTVQSNEVDQRPSWTVLGPHQVELLASRSGSGGDRRYRITIACDDGQGHAASKPVDVVVPHDLGR